LTVFAVEVIHVVVMSSLSLLYHTHVHARTHAHMHARTHARMHTHTSVYGSMDFVQDNLDVSVPE